MNNWIVKIITSMPNIFPGSLNNSLVGKALEKGIWELETIDLRNFSYDERGSIDDYPFGGGPGMVIRPDVIEKAIKKAQENMESELRLVYMTPGGRPLNQKKLEQFSNENGLIILCGRFEGVDERVLDAYNFEQISIGDYVLSNGETAAMVLIEGCVRLLKGVVGKQESLNNESFSNDLLEYPQYTRPQVWIDEQKKEHKVPEVLISGNHKKINEWKKKMSLEKTKKIRPDLKNFKKDN